MGSEYKSPWGQMDIIVLCVCFIVYPLPGTYCTYCNKISYKRSNAKNNHLNKNTWL